MNRRLFSNSMFLKKGNKFFNKSYCTVTPDGKVKARGGRWEREREEERLPPFLYSHRPTPSDACFLFFKLSLFLSQYQAGAYAEKRATPQICVPQCDVTLSPCEIS